MDDDRRSIATDVLSFPFLVNISRKTHTLGKSTLVPPYHLPVRSFRPSSLSPVHIDADNLHDAETANSSDTASPCWCRREQASHRGQTHHHPGLRKESMMENLRCDGIRKAVQDMMQEDMTQKRRRYEDGRWTSRRCKQGIHTWRISRQTYYYSVVGAIALDDPKRSGAAQRGSAKKGFFWMIPLSMSRQVANNAGCCVLLTGQHLQSRTSDRGRVGERKDKSWNATVARHRHFETKIYIPPLEVLQQMHPRLVYPSHPCRSYFFLQGKT
ncbi:hypothetical protein ACRALDRAFT_2049549 [Sodiomyces alcalophilus JCM 7366]|uniref:uncharacterized protein n=1 Tax=Sodiomyces alcalophilus JCM 7366 TaxID=591952 RepID=UPI0039B622D3